MRLFDNRYFRPAKSGKYLVLKKSGEYDVLEFSARHNGWNQFDDLDRMDGIEVTGWTHLPRKDQALIHMITREG